MGARVEPTVRGEAASGARPTHLVRAWSPLFAAVCVAVRSVAVWLCARVCVSVSVRGVAADGGQGGLDPEAGRLAQELEDAVAGARRGRAPAPLLHRPGTPPLCHAPRASPLPFVALFPSRSNALQSVAEHTSAVVEEARRLGGGHRRACHGQERFAFKERASLRVTGSRGRDRGAGAAAWRAAPRCTRQPWAPSRRHNGSDDEGTALRHHSCR